MNQCEVALSFAGPQREYVRQIAWFLQAKGVAVFYDEFEQVSLWGKELTETLHEVFGRRAKLVVMFVSADYVTRAWPRHERRAALSRAVCEPSEFILPVRFDDSDVPGLSNAISYLDAREKGPMEIAMMICQKLGVHPLAAKADAVPPPTMTSPTGEVVFDYSSHNGRYVIGCGPMEFETQWSKASDTSIHLYNDPPSINGIALVKKRQSFEEVTDAAAQNYTSRSRTIPRGGFATLHNKHGIYAVVQVLDIKDDTRAENHDELRFKYAIQTDGSDDFSSFAEPENAD